MLLNVRRTASSAVVTMALLLLISPAAHAATFGPWGAAVNVEAIAGTSTEFNTPYTDGCPIQSPNGLRFYMASNRPGGLGGLDIWVAHRASTTDPWGAPHNLGAPINGAADDFCPTPVRGQGLFFVSARDGGCGGPDVYFARRDASGGWTTPADLGCDVNSAAPEAGPSLVTADGDRALYFSSQRPGGVDADTGAIGDADIYRSRLRADGTFGTAQLVAALSTTDDDARPNVRKDGLEVVFDSTRPGTLGGPDIYAATRPSTASAWGAPANLGSAINTAFSETRASLSWDGATLYFGSNRPGSELAPDGVTTSNDIYTSTR